MEDRALFCKDCDDPIHSANSRAANHQRFLATGIRVALGTSCSKENVVSESDPKPPKSTSKTTPLHVSGITSPSWGVDDLLQLSEYSSSDKKEQMEFNELEWLTDISLFDEQVPEALSAAEVPQLPTSQPSHMFSYRPAKPYAPNKKLRIEVPDDEEFFIVPDLG